MLQHWFTEASYVDQTPPSPEGEEPVSDTSASPDRQDGEGLEGATDSKTTVEEMKGTNSEPLSSPHAMEEATLSAAAS